MKDKHKWIIFLGLIGFFLGFYFFKYPKPLPDLPTAMVQKRDIKVEVKTVGELEAARSITIASSIKGDQGKIIELIGDGLYVQPGQVLIRLDSAPFEEKREKLRIQVKEQEAYVKTLEQTLEWEIIQSEHKNRMAFLELESAQLELDKVLYGDGPQEASRLKGALQKALLKYEELNAYSNDLIDLERQGFLNYAEVMQAEKKLSEEREAYEMAQLQYDSFIQHVHPMQIKKAEAHLKRAQVSQEEIAKGGTYGIAKSHTLLEQAKEVLHDCFLQLREAEQELLQTEIVAPAQGMVVLREEYRSSQKRKPRVGDVLLRNQPLIDLPDLSAMKIKTRVREVDLFKVTQGKKGKIRVDAYPQLAFSGTVSTIGVLALSDVGRFTEEKFFEVYMTLDQTDQRLRPGMTTRVVIEGEEVSDVIAIPLHSLFNEGGENYCYIYQSGRQCERREVKIGISNDQWVEIKSGVREGEVVCLLNPFSR